MCCRTLCYRITCEQRPSKDAKAASGVRMNDENTISLTENCCYQFRLLPGELVGAADIQGPNRWENAFITLNGTGRLFPGSRWSRKSRIIPSHGIGTTSSPWV